MTCKQFRLQQSFRRTRCVVLLKEPVMQTVSKLVRDLRALGASYETRVDVSEALGTEPIDVASLAKIAATPATTFLETEEKVGVISYLLGGTKNK
jgi:hypothetical protein